MYKHMSDLEWIFVGSSMELTMLPLMLPIFYGFYLTLFTTITRDVKYEEDIMALVT